MRQAEDSMDGKVAVVTGGASGLGLEVARLLTGRGGNLVIVDRDPKLLEEAVTSLERGGTDAVGLPGDVSVTQTAADAIGLAVTRHGRIDILCNNAGIDPVRVTNILETNVDEWDRIMAVNVRGAYLFCKAAI